MACTQIQEERKEKKGKKDILGQIILNHHIRTTQGGRGSRDESNNAVEVLDHPSKSAAHVAQNRWSSALASNFFFFLHCTKLKMPPRPINTHKQTMLKLPQSP